MNRNLYMTLINVAIFVALGTIGNAQSGLVAIKVDVVSDKDYGKPPGEGEPRTVVDQKSLLITLRNLGPKNFTSLEVRHYLFVDNFNNGKVESGAEGEHKTDLPKGGTVKVESKAKTFKYTPAHSKTIGDRRERVEKEGEKFVGYGVQVLTDGKIIAEVFEPKDLRKILDSK